MTDPGAIRPAVRIVTTQEGVKFYFGPEMRLRLLSIGSRNISKMVGSAASKDGSYESIIRSHDPRKTFQKYKTDFEGYGIVVITAKPQK